MQATLDPHFYYLANFQQALSWLKERYSDLLIDSERQFLTQFGELNTSSQALLVRMIMRKGVHFRLSKLDYTEIGCSSQAAQPLLDAGWITDSAELSLDELFNLLRKDEVLTYLGSAQLPKSLNKTDLLAQLSSANPPPRAFAQWCERSQERIFSLCIDPLCERLRLMFFGNLRQDWTEFVLAELGIFIYEQVPLNADSRAFRSRADVDCYLALQRCREQFEAGESVSEILQQINAQPCDSLFLAARRNKLLLRMGQQLEREGNFEGALAVYVDCNYVGARLRRIRVFERIAQPEPAYQLALEAASAPENDAEAQAVARALHRLARQLAKPQAAANKPLAPARLDLCLAQPDAASVEYAVKEHLSEAHAPVFYVENGLICSLFGLLCWPAIFAPLPGAFFHPFHTGPVDLYSSDFHRRREQLFAACLAHLETDTYKHVIRTTYAEKFATQSPFVFWSMLEPQLLELALTCIPAAHLAAWFKRLLSDIKANRAGMPDLIQFWPEEQRYRMIEVKGPGDRLQDNQRRWLTFCAEHGMPVDVCYVKWTDA